VTEVAPKEADPATNGTEPEDGTETKVAKVLSRWSRVSDLGAAMAARGVAGSEAVNYLRHAFGVSRTRAYELIRGSVDPSELQVKVLAPLLGDEAVAKLLARIEDESDRRSFASVESSLRKRGDVDLADRLHAFSEARLGRSE